MNNMRKEQKRQLVIIYRTKSGALELPLDAKKEIIWTNRAQMAKIFNVNPQAIFNIFLIYTKKRSYLVDQLAPK